ncbi:MAG: hypothetical protein IB616_01525 [Methanosarcinales archaeon]|nr:MAG: hypothetical protein IB616_01525 [Methanosarcinales archaeon]
MKVITKKLIGACEINYDAMRKIIAVLIVLTILTATTGCLEPKEAAPARVSEAALAQVGWVQEGDVQKQTLETNVSEVTIKANIATVVYKDRALEDKIAHDTGGLISGVSSYLMTIRLVLPLGISPPADLVFNLGEEQFLQKARETVPDMQQAGTRTISIAGGHTTDARIYEGTINYEGGSVGVRGILAMWDANGSTIVVGAVTPVEDLTYQGITIVQIDGEAEFNEAIALIQSVT